MDIDSGNCKSKVEPGSEKLPNGYTRDQIAAAITSRVQELIILPTEQCNFRCTYCYEDFELGKMSETTQRAIERFLDKRVPELKQLNFAWFGGEPLVAKDVVLRLSRYAKKLCDLHDVEFRGHLTTNGYQLDVKLATDLIECGQRSYQITVDGWEDAHDVLRQRADGKGTFKRIWSNLIGLKKINTFFEVQVRIHVRRDNLQNLFILMEKFAIEFNGDARFTLDFQHLRDLGGEGGATIENAIKFHEMEEITNDLMNVYRRALARHREEDEAKYVRVSRTPSEEKIKRNEAAGESARNTWSGESSSEPYICYAAKPNSILIRSNGRIGKCTVALSDDRNDLGYLKEDGTLHINNNKLTPWIRGLGSLSNSATGCPMVNMPKVEMDSPYPNGFGGKKIVPIAFISA